MSAAAAAAYTSTTRQRAALETAVAAQFIAQIQYPPSKPAAAAKTGPKDLFNNRSYRTEQEGFSSTWQPKISGISGRYDPPCTPPSSPTDSFFGSSPLGAVTCFEPHVSTSTLCSRSPPPPSLSSACLPRRRLSPLCIHPILRLPCFCRYRCLSARGPSACVPPSTQL